MRDIYLIDFENVSSDGLSGIIELAEEDHVIIFYSSNSNRLSMKMHILIGKSACKLNYFEVSVGGKNALDHQISTWLGYLIGTEAADRYYIVSKDMGYKHVANFWAENDGRPKVYCADSIQTAKSSAQTEPKKTEEKQEMLEPVIQAAPKLEEKPAHAGKTAKAAPRQARFTPKKTHSEKPGREHTARKQVGQPQKPEKGQLEQLHALIAPYPGLQENTLRDLIQNNKRQILCNTLRKQLGQEKGLALYNEIKKSAWK